MADSHLKHFIDKAYQLRGVVHVGANDGAEVSWYLEHNLRPVLCFEPHPAAIERAQKIFGAVRGVTFIQCALGREDGNIDFLIPSDGDDEKTSRYKPVPTFGHDWTLISTGSSIKVPVLRFDGWCDRNKIDLSPYDSLVIDAQGMELEVLEGFGNRLQHFDFLCIELSAKPVYDGEASASQVIQFLTDHEFVQDSQVEEHDDVLFVRRHLAR